VLLPVNSPFRIELSLRSWTSSGSNGGAGFAETDFLNTFGFASGGALNLPTGFTAASPTIGSLSAPAGTPGGATVPVPGALPLGIAGLALVGLLRRRRAG
jgi:hypothetical protein